MNYTAFALAVELSEAVQTHPVVGVAIGSLAGMSVNYVLYAAFVFRTRARA